MVAGGFDPHASWPTPDEVADRGDPAAAGRPGRGAGRDPRREVAGQGVDEDRGQPRPSSADPRRSLARLREIEPDLRAVGRLTGEVQWTAADVPLVIDVELVPADA